MNADTTISCNYQNIAELAHAIKDVIELESPRRYTVNPWNRFEFINSEWLVVPSREWPAYPFGKGVMRPSRRSPGHVLCCYYIEKGFDPLVAQVYPDLVRRGFILNRNWMWHRFLNLLTDGNIAHAAQTVQDATGSRVIMEVTLEYPSSPQDYEPHSIEDDTGQERSATDGGRVWFALDRGNLVKLAERWPQQLLQPIAASTSLSALAAAFKGNKLAWAWVNVYIGVEIRLSLTNADAEQWEAGALWRGLFKPWQEWIA